MESRVGETLIFDVSSALMRSNFKQGVLVQVQIYRNCINYKFTENLMKDQRSKGIHKCIHNKKNINVSRDEEDEGTWRAQEEAYRLI